MMAELPQVHVIDPEEIVLTEFRRVREQFHNERLWGDITITATMRDGEVQQVETHARSTVPVRKVKQ